MLASLNLQLLSATTSLDGSSEGTSIGIDHSTEAGASPRPFASFLSVRSESFSIQPNVSGDFLPVDGKPLPPIAPPAVPPKPAQDLIPPKIEIPVDVSSSDPHLRSLSDEEFLPDLWVSLVSQTPVTAVAEINLNSELDLDVNIPLTELVDTTSPAVNPLPTGLPAELSTNLPLEMTRAHADKLPAPDFSRPLHVEQDTALPVRPAPLIDPALSAAVSVETDKLRMPVREAVAVMPVADIPIRERTLTPTAPVAAPSVTATDAPLLADDVRVAGALPSPGRVVSALETMSLPDSRVAAITASQNSAATHFQGQSTVFGLEPTADRPELLTDTIKTSLRDNAWGEKLGERVLMMTGKQLQAAEIRLTPADLGPVRVRVSVEEGAAHVTFHAQHATTREAIEQALPRLREMLSESGLSLGQTDVSERGVADQRDDQAFSSNASKESQDELSETAIESEQSERRKTVTSRYLLDTFA